MPALDYQTAFQLAPVGMAMSRERVMLDVNAKPHASSATRAPR